MSVQEHMPHKLVLNERKSLTVTGVTEVVSFDESAVVFHTELGTMVVQGTQLQLKNLSSDGGQITVEGEVSSIAYEQLRQSGGWLHRLLG